jgi:hypothetical protein
MVSKRQTKIDKYKMQYGHTHAHTHVCLCVCVRTKYVLRRNLSAHFKKVDDWDREIKRKKKNKESECERDG